jgi:hypothetical protein
MQHNQRNDRARAHTRTHTRERDSLSRTHTRTHTRKNVTEERWPASDPFRPAGIPPPTATLRVGPGSGGWRRWRREESNLINLIPTRCRVAPARASPLLEAGDSGFGICLNKGRSASFGNENSKLCMENTKKPSWCPQQCIDEVIVNSRMRNC